MYSEVLAARARQLKEAAKGVESMCQEMDQTAPRWNCRHFPAGRRHWYHEYHACVSHRADKRSDSGKPIDALRYEG